MLDGAAADNANGPLIREHFGLDDPKAKRGKRLRPQILLTVAESEGGDGTVALGAAAALELLHNFSLIHDDIEDGDEMRHGRPTLWARHGVRAALVAGDAMSALAYLTLVDGSRALPPATRRGDDALLCKKRTSACARDRRSTSASRPRRS